MRKIHLKTFKETPVKAGHPWVFSHALEEEPDLPAGELVMLCSHEGSPLGIGTYNKNCSIRIRMISLNAEEKIDLKFFTERFKGLDELKKSLLPPKTTGYRIVHAEGDNLPGLVLDRYGDAFVFQLHTAGMELLREVIIEAIKKVFKPRIIVERSDLEVRRQEGLSPLPPRIHLGEIDEMPVFEENGIKFYADVLKGQKTGFYLDQRTARIKMMELAEGKKVLNLCSYTGAFGLYALKAGAAFVNNVDVSESALDLAKKNLELNKFTAKDKKKVKFTKADVFEFLEQKKLADGPYDLIVCDPPAFAKSERQLEHAAKAYTDLNQSCLYNLNNGGILITSSCSGRITPDDFRSILRISAGRARRDVQILEWLSQAPDHTEKLAFSEGRYLKTAVLRVKGLL
jgi:23S rRNA (cytosine1962-C5)-methyltransferase